MESKTYFQPSDAKTTGRVSVQTNKGRAYFSTGQTIRLEASSNYTKIYFADHFSLLTAKVLKDFEPLLMPLGFVRTHRSHMVNKQHIARVCSNGALVMKDYAVVEISKRRKFAVLQALQLSGVRA